MDKFLRPRTLEINPESPNAADEWEMWLNNFNEFFKSIDATLSPDKLVLMKAHVSCSIYKLIKHTTTFSDALAILNVRFIKPRSEVFARYRLATCRQQPGENLDQFLDNLKGLSHDCNFSTSSAEIICEQAIRDAFIAGMASNAIRQRLLENLTLNLTDAVSQARALEMAQHHSEAYQYSSSSRVTSAAAMRETSISSKQDSLRGKNRTPDDSNPSDRHDDDVATTASVQRRCYFCGGAIHPRNVCKARNATCNKCGKVGHFAKVCRSAALSRRDVEPTSASLLATLYSSPLIGVSCAVVVGYVNGKRMEILIDTGSSSSYVSGDIVEACGLKVSPVTGYVSMASTSHKSSTSGRCSVSLELGGRLYPGMLLSVMEDLCAPVLLGHDFLRQHESVTVKFGGKLPPIELCGFTAFTAARIEPPALFNDLSEDCRPIQTRSRRHSPKDENYINKEIDRLLKEGVIVPSSSPWRAQVLVIPQGDKSRMVVDYSMTINRFTNLNAYPLPGINEMIEKISRYETFSSIDLKSAYHQIPLRKEEQKYTAFEASGRLFEFTRIPFGVTNGVACFQKIINDIIDVEKLQDTFAYVDDITVCGNDIEEHNRNLARFQEAAKKYGLTINTEKSSFCSNRIAILGHVIENKTIRPDPERMWSLLEIPPPSDAKSLKRVLGLLSHYSKWIPAFSEKARPLINNDEFPLDERAVESFDQLIHEISQATLYAIQDDVPFVVETDASNEAIAASLSQEGRPVAFFTRSLNSTEKMHSSIEKEASAIVESIRKWRHFLIGRPFKVITDQQAVSFMFDGQNKGKVKNDKIQRWRLELASFNFDIVFRPGKKNLVADTLTRVSSDGKFSASAPSHVSLEDLHASLSHPGVTRLWHAVRARNLPFSLDDVRSVIRNCSTCAELKPQFVKYSGQLVKSTRPFEKLCIDFKGPLPSCTRHKYLLIVVDEYSRFPFAFPTTDTSAETTIQCLLSLFSLFGVPEFIHSDNGPAFASSAYRNFLLQHNISTSYSSVYNPRGNGQAERYVGTIWKTVRLSLHSRHLSIEKWESVLQVALHSIRSLLCTSTNCTPHERFLQFPRKAMYGTTLPTWLLNADSAFLRSPVRQSKYDNEVETVKLLHINPQYARVQHDNGRESTVSLRRLAPRGDEPMTMNEQLNLKDNEMPQVDPRKSGDRAVGGDSNSSEQHGPTGGDGGLTNSYPSEVTIQPEDVTTPSFRRSNRIRKQPDRYDPSKFNSNSSRRGE